MAGYSGTPLFKKLGIKPTYRMRISNAPSNYRELISGVPDDALISSRIAKDIDLWHIFTRDRRQLEQMLPDAMKKIHVDGMIWVSWPKKTSALARDLTGNDVRRLGLAAGLVDVKICAVDEDWSGLKFVYRLKDRARR